MLNKPQLRNLAAQIYHYFHDKDRPAADRISVPVDSIRQDPEKKDIYYATVRFYVNWVKSYELPPHQIRIRLQVDNNGRFIPSRREGNRHRENWQYTN